MSCRGHRPLVSPGSCPLVVEIQEEPECQHDRNANERADDHDAFVSGHVRVQRAGIPEPADDTGQVCSDPDCGASDEEDGAEQEVAQASINVVDQADECGDGAVKHGYPLGFVVRGHYFYR